MAYFFKGCVGEELETDVALGLDLRQRGPPELPRAPLLPLAARHVLPATAGCEAHLESSPLPETPWRHAQSCKSVPRRSRETESRPQTEARRYPKVLYCMRRTLMF